MDQPSKPHHETVDVDISSLGKRFFPDLDLISDQTICPSLKDFDLGDPNGSLDIPFLRAPEDWRNDPQSEAGAGFADPSGIMLDDDMAIGFDNDDDATITGLDMDGDIGFGQGGEVWAREALEGGGSHGLIGVPDENGGDGTILGPDENDPYAMTMSLANMSAAQEQESILSYFDNALKKNWTGPEHWKIRKIKDANAATNTIAATRAARRKEKEAFEINFADNLDPAAAALIYTPAASNASLSMPKSQWKTKGRNLLPDDKHFNSRQLLRLFLKPRARMGFFSKGRAGGGTAYSQLPNATNIDETFWANQKNPADTSAEEGAQGAYDANFFADDDGLAYRDGLPDDDDDNAPFVDAAENLISTDATIGGTTGLATLLNQTGIPESQGFGSQLVTQGGRRVRPEYIAYAKTAKKVDVRRLKDTMWKGMGEKLPESKDYDSAAKDAAIAKEEDLDRQKANEALTPSTSSNANKEGQDDLDTSSLRFTSVMNDLKTSYNEPALKDISTSYCFICLLHLANEKGLVLKNRLENKGGVEGWTDGAGGLDEIYVARDRGAITEEAQL
ncbi:hypothetical protein KEM54_002309 [Ascosphaera aggregata]|nr:hypothetical protein KEM54_002309 [Ascosphaera aggregata]